MDLLDELDWMTLGGGFQDAVDIIQAPGMDPRWKASNRLPEYRNTGIIHAFSLFETFYTIMGKIPPIPHRHSLLPSPITPQSFSHYMLLLIL